MKLQLTEEQKRRRRNKYQREYYQRKRDAKNGKPSIAYNPGIVFNHDKTPSYNDLSDQVFRLKKLNTFLIDCVANLTNLYGNN